MNIINGKINAFDYINLKTNLYKMPYTKLKDRLWTRRT